MANLEIKSMQPEDIPEVATMEALIFTQPWSANGFASSLQSADTEYLVVRSDGMLVGYCGLLQSLEEADITNVAVHPDWRNQGIAFAMLKELIKRGNARGIVRFTLEVRVGNASAIHLYEKLGFRSAGIRKNFYDLPKEDAMIMWTS